MRRHTKRGVLVAASLLAGFAPTGAQTFTTYHCRGWLRIRRGVLRSRQARAHSARRQGAARYQSGYGSRPALRQRRYHFAHREGPHHAQARQAFDRMQRGLSGRTEAPYAGRSRPSRCQAMTSSSRTRASTFVAVGKGGQTEDAERGGLVGFGLQGGLQFGGRGERGAAGCGSWPILAPSIRQGGLDADGLSAAEPAAMAIRLCPTVGSLLSPLVRQPRGRQQRARPVGRFARISQDPQAALALAASANRRPPRRPKPPRPPRSASSARQRSPSARNCGRQRSARRRHRLARGGGRLRPTSARRLASGRSIRAESVEWFPGLTWCGPWRCAK